MPLQNRRSVCVSSFVVFLVVCLPAVAQTPPPDASPAAHSPPRPGEVSPSDVSFRGGLGGFSDPGDGGGVLLQASGLYRLGPLGLGAQLEGGATVFEYGYSGVGALAGVALRPDARVRVEVLGTFGGRHYSGVGRGFLNDDPGVSGDTTYVGARAGAAYLFGTNTNHTELGLYGGVDEDLSRETKTSRYTSTSWFGGESTTQESQHTIGTRRYSLLVAVGWTHDVW
jgi:hypothetical protein